MFVLLRGFEHLWQEYVLEMIKFNIFGKIIYITFELYTGRKHSARVGDDAKIKNKKEEEEKKTSINQ